MKGHTHTHTHETALNKMQGHNHPELIGQVLITHSHHHTHPAKFRKTETAAEHEAKMLKFKKNGMSAGMR